jgi:hypothetical protein
MANPWKATIKTTRLTARHLMLKTVEGMYQDGQIQLSELPEGVSDRSQVLVTFLQPGSIDPAQLHQVNRSTRDHCGHSAGA